MATAQELARQLEYQQRINRSNQVIQQTTPSWLDETPIPYESVGLPEPYVTGPFMGLGQAFVGNQEQFAPETVAGAIKAGQLAKQIRMAQKPQSLAQSSPSAQAAAPMMPSAAAAPAGLAAMPAIASPIGTVAGMAAGLQPKGATAPSNLNPYAQDFANKQMSLANIVNVPSTSKVAENVAPKLAPPQKNIPAAPSLFKQSPAPVAPAPAQAVAPKPDQNAINQQILRAASIRYGMAVPQMTEEEQMQQIAGKMANTRDSGQMRGLARQMQLLQAQQQRRDMLGEAKVGREQAVTLANIGKEQEIGKATALGKAQADIRAAAAAADLRKVQEGVKGRAEIAAEQRKTDIEKANLLGKQKQEQIELTQKMLGARDIIKRATTPSKVSKEMRDAIALRLPQGWQVRVDPKTKAVDEAVVGAVAERMATTGEDFMTAARNLQIAEKEAPKTFFGKTIPEEEKKLQALRQQLGSYRFSGVAPAQSADATSSGAVNPSEGNAAKTTGQSESIPVGTVRADAKNQRWMWNGSKWLKESV